VDLRDGTRLLSLLEILIGKEYVSGQKIKIASGCYFLTLALPNSGGKRAGCEFIT